MAGESPRPKRPKDQEGAEKSKKPEPEDSTAQAALPIEPRRTTDEEREALEKAVDQLIGKAPAEISEEGTSVDRPPLGVVPEESGSEWKEEQELARKKEEEERAERRKVRRGRGREREGNVGKDA